MMTKPVKGGKVPNLPAHLTVTAQNRIRSTTSHDYWRDDPRCTAMAKAFADPAAHEHQPIIQTVVDDAQLTSWPRPSIWSHVAALFDWYDLTNPKDPTS